MSKINIELIPKICIGFLFLSDQDKDREIPMNIEVIDSIELIFLDRNRTKQKNR
jgi:hypothetical protein